MSPVSFLLLSYQSEATIAAALEAALAQDLPGIEIVVSDDCSADRSHQIALDVASRYRGPHRLKCIRNDHNQGLVGNILAGAAHCSGKLIVLSAGDDRSRPERVRTLHQAWCDAGAPDAAYLYSDVQPVDADGRPIADWPEWVARPTWTLERLADGASGPLGATEALTPSLLDWPVPIDRSVRHEDRVFPFRALLKGGPILFVDRPLVDYCTQGGVSRHEARSRLEQLTTIAAKQHRAMLPDARQRLLDARAAAAAPSIIRRCERQLVEQEALLGLSQGGSVIPTTLAALRSGARPLPLLAYLARLTRARAEAFFRGSATPHTPR